jgi:glycosyltransferase involved in cell wall biosynthesis
MNLDYSIIIPAHNEEKHIGRTISNLKHIMPENSRGEIIVVADACTDRTIDVVTKNYKTDGKIKNPLNRVIQGYGVNFKKASKSRNAGAKRALGKVLIFHDADTIASKNYIERILNEVSKGNEYGCARWRSESNYDIPLFWATSLNIGSKKLRVINGNGFVTKRVFEKEGGFREDLFRDEDTEFSERLRSNGYNFSFIDDAWIMPSERKWKEMGYLRAFIKFNVDTLRYFFNKEEQLVKHSDKN